MLFLCIEIGIWTVGVEKIQRRGSLLYPGVEKATSICIVPSRKSKWFPFAVVCNISRHSPSSTIGIRKWCVFVCCGEKRSEEWCDGKIRSMWFVFIKHEETYRFYFHFRCEVLIS